MDTDFGQARADTASNLTLEQALAELEIERERAAKNLTGWQRAEADFQNYKRRMDQERAERARYASESVLADLLGVLDDLERALASATEAEAGWLKGVELTRKNLETVLDRHGAKEIVALGLGFDPSLHEAAMELPGAEGTVVAVVKRGWRLHDRIIRPAMVGVGNGRPTA